MDLIPRLIAAGFTEYEAKVYLALVGEHPATGYHLSKTSGVPRSMVYESLGRLHTRGAVLKTEEHRATLFRPVPPDILLDRLDQEHHKLLHDLRDGLGKLYKTQAEERLWSINGRSPVISYATKVINDASEEIMLVIGDRELADLKHEILARCEAGVQVNVLLTGDELLQPDSTEKLDADYPGLHFARHPPLESQLQELTHMLLIVTDRTTCLIANTEPQTGTMTATMTNNPQMVFIARQFVWMELFTQRLSTKIEPELLKRLSPEDQEIFLNLSMAN
jgi:Cd2+/Zn2+-exporting ATPase